MGSTRWIWISFKRQSATQRKRLCVAERKRRKHNADLKHQEDKEKRRKNAKDAKAKRELEVVKFDNLPNIINMEIQDN